MASIKDVAEMAGVSLSTASIVVNGKAEERKISEATQNKVMNAMRQLNYIPNVSAKILRRGEAQSYVVALFWNFDFRSIMMHRFLFGFQKKIAEENVNMSIIIHPYRTGELRKEAASFEGGEFHAAVIGNADANDLKFLKDSAFQVPIVLYNRLLEGYCSVNVDDEKIGQMAAEHLYAQGYRRPAVIHGTQNFPGATKREAAFLERMEKLGSILPKNKMIYAGNSLKGGYECAKILMEKIIEETKREAAFLERMEKLGSILPKNKMIYAGNSLKGGYECAKILMEKIIEEPADSYFCASDSIALGFLTAFAESGKIPQQIGVLAIGNSDPQYSLYHSPSLSVINIPIEEMAEQCCSFLIERMYAPRLEAVSEYFETELFERETTRKRLNI